MVKRTVPIKLDIPQQHHPTLKETFLQFNQATQHVADVSWRIKQETGYIEKNKNTLHEITYQNIRDKLDLNAQHVQQARNLAANALKGCVESMKKGKKTSKPNFKPTVIKYDKNTITYNQKHCTLATVNGRIKAKYKLPKDTNNPQHKYFKSSEWEKQEATLHYRNNTYYLHVTVENNEEEYNVGKTEDRTVLGVDLNVNGYLAVTSTGRFLQSADGINHKREEYEKRRASLQQTGTRSAHLTIKRIGSRFSEWSEDLVHRVANELIEEAREHDCNVIVFENLKDIRGRISDGKKFQQWMFGKLYDVVEYKAKAQGVDVKQVNPAYTSQRCSKCGFTHKKNRGGDEFRCQKCGYELHADYNAGKNIGYRYCSRVLHGLKSHGGRAFCQLALKSGTVKVNV